MSDELGAFCEHDQATLEGAAEGPLKGLRFAAKDIFDVAGATCCCGSPEWLSSHRPAARTAAAIQLLVDAGASLVGKTVTDELTYSLIGENAHYGTPVNSAAPGRVPGGSSSGSAAAAAGGVVDFALGSDTGGSVRVPASFCGLYGLRPSHGAIPLDGAMPLAPSFDTAGWFARDAEVFARVGRVLLGHDGPLPKPSKVLLAEDVMARTGDEVRAALAPALTAVSAALGEPVPAMVVAPADDLGAWAQCFRTLQAAEVWATHGDWVERVRPSLGPGVRERFAWARTVSDDDVARVRPLRQRVTREMAALLAGGAVLCLPAAAGAAPPVGSSESELEGVRGRLLELTAIAGLARLPQLSLPLAEIDGCPLGLSLIAARGADALLLGAALAVAEAAA